MLLIFVAAAIRETRAESDLVSFLGIVASSVSIFITSSCLVGFGLTFPVLPFSFLVDGSLSLSEDTDSIED